MGRLLLAEEQILSFKSRHLNIEKAGKNGNGRVVSPIVLVPLKITLLHPERS